MAILIRLTSRIVFRIEVTEECRMIVCEHQQTLTQGPFLECPTDPRCQMNLHDETLKQYAVLTMLESTMLTPKFPVVDQAHPRIRPRHPRK